MITGIEEDNIRELQNGSPLPKINRPLTQAESKLILEGQDKETITQTRFWRLRPDDIVFRPPTESETGIFCILEFKRISDITDQYLIPRREPIYIPSKGSRGNDTTPRLTS